MGRLFFASLAGRLFLIGFGTCTSANRLMCLQAGIPDREDRAEQQDSRPAVVSVIWRSLILLCARSYPLGYSYLSCPPIMAFLLVLPRHYSINLACRGSETQVFIKYLLGRALHARSLVD